MNRPGPNWFEQTARPSFEEHLGKEQPRGEALQIGAYCGDATAWLLDHGWRVTDVDTWRGSGEHDGIDFAKVEEFYDERFGLVPGTRLGIQGGLTKRKMTSVAFWLLNGWFDFIYVDGDHRAAQVMNDGVHAFSKLKVGGVLAFDDYLWVAPSGDPQDCPHHAINSFMMLFQRQVKILEIGTQVWLRKTAEL